MPKIRKLNRIFVQEGKGRATRYLHISKIELKELVDKGLFDVRGKGKGTRYILSTTIK